LKYGGRVLAFKDLTIVVAKQLINQQWEGMECTAAAAYNHRGYII
jgi:hypothetical protein